MNRPFVIVRAVFYVLLWVVICVGLRRFSMAMDRAGAPDHTLRLRAFSAVLLPALGITGSWAAFDWLMSLSPDWYSTMYGLYVLAGGFLGSLALMVVLVVGLQRDGYLVGVQRAALLRARTPAAVVRRLLGLRRLLPVLPDLDRRQADRIALVSRAPARRLRRRQRIPRRRRTSRSRSWPFCPTRSSRARACCA